MATHADRLDFDAINAAALARYRSLLESWFPNGKVEGHEFKVGNLAGEPGRSLSINLNTGVWADFADQGVGGSDPISLYAAKFCGNDQGRAARELADLLGMGGGTPTAAPAKQPASGGTPWQPILPVPANAPAPRFRHPAHGEPAAVWTYHDAGGRVLGYVCRFNLPDGSKEILPLSFCANPKRERRWRWLSFPKPRPLYGLDRLAAAPGANVVVVEGEKCADAAVALFPGAVVVSWPGGGKAVRLADWAALQGRKVVIWPDWDRQPKHKGTTELKAPLEQPGMVSALWIAEALHGIAAAVRILLPPEDKPDGWDAADAVAEGWTAESTADYLRANLYDVDGVRAKLGGAEPEPEEPPAPEPPPDNDAAREPQAGGARFELTDAGNAARICAQHGDNLRWVPAWGWLAWDGRRWRKDDLEARALAVAVARGIHAEAARVTHPDRRKAITKWAERSQQAQRISAALWLAEPALAAEPKDFDADPWLLCVRNGTLDLRTGTLREHRREDRITRMVDVDYDPRATAPTWAAFLARVQPDAEARAFLRRWSGYSLTGKTGEQCFVVNWGSGANGKSTYIATMLRLLGEYAAQADFATFLQRKEQGIRNDIARLAGARMVAAVEGPEGARLDAAVVKSITGDDVVAARFLHREFFEFRPAFKLQLATNHRPVIRDTSEAMWRRVRLLPWLVTIPAAERDPDLPEKLRAELAGILAWCVAGCLEWQRQGLAPPPEVMAATNAYRDDQDDIGRWLDERCVMAPNALATSASLYRDYTAWCEGQGLHAVSQRRLGDQLRDRGFTSDRDRARGRLWRGVGLLSELADAYRRATNGE